MNVTPAHLCELEQHHALPQRDARHSESRVRDPGRSFCAMRFVDVLLTALTQIRRNKLRSFFTLLGIIVSVGFLVAVIAIIQGMNA